MRASLALGLVLALGLGTFVPADASAWCRMTTSPRRVSVAEPCIFPDPMADPPEHYLAWLRPCSGIALSVTSASRDLTRDEILGVFGRSIAAWEAVSCGGQPLGIDIQLMSEESTCDRPVYRDGGGNVNAVVFTFDWAEREYDPNAFAVTTVWHRRSTGEILDVDMDLNERRGPYGICPVEGCATRTVDLENVVTHELGHYLGIAHSEEVEATMYASAVAGETIKRDLHPDDIEGLCVIYPPGTPSAECDYAPRGGLVLHCEEGCSTSTPGRQDAPLWPLALLALIPLRARASRRRS